MSQLQVAFLVPNELKLV